MHSAFPLHFGIEVVRTRLRCSAAIEITFAMFIFEIVFLLALVLKRGQMSLIDY